MKREWIPNLVTMGSLATGFTSLLFTFHSQFEWAALAILLAGLLDGLDGRVARLLGVSSPMGVELDSLADLVSFGVAPGFLLYALDLHHVGVFGAAIATLYAVGAGFRLARFNLGTPPGLLRGVAQHRRRGHRGFFRALWSQAPFPVLSCAGPDVSRIDGQPVALPRLQACQTG